MTYREPERDDDDRPRLAPIKVADFSSHVSGPTASLFLRAVGAKVVKIENPRHGDGTRHMSAAPEVSGSSIYHFATNWGAQSVTADPTSPDWPAWVDGFARWADVIIVSGRPSDIERLGLSRNSILTANPMVIHCTVTGYGMSGPWAERAAHGQNTDALAGIVEVDSDDETLRPLPWQPVSASLAGVMAALGTMAALYHRAMTGHPLAVETSLWESAVWWNWRQLISTSATGATWGKVAEFGSRYGTYRTADGRALLVAPVEQKFWQRFCAAADLQAYVDIGDWSDRYDFGEPDHGPEWRVLTDTIRSRTLDDWVSRLAPTGIPFCEVLSAREVLSTDHFAAREMGVPVDGALAVRPPVDLVDAFGHRAVRPGTSLPPLGDSTEAFARRFGVWNTGS